MAHNVIITRNERTNLFLTEYRLDLCASDIPQLEFRRQILYIIHKSTETQS